MPDILLFRTPTPDDTYAPLLAAAGYTSCAVRVLDDEIDVRALVPIVRAGAGRWEGVIVTSRRAGEAWVRAVREIEGGQATVEGEEGDEGPAREEGKEAERKRRGGEEVFLPWSALRVYSPGPAVGSVLSELHARWRPSSVTAVSAAQLAPIVLAASPREAQNNVRGDQGRDRGDTGVAGTDTDSTDTHADTDTDARAGARDRGHTGPTHHGRAGTAQETAAYPAGHSNGNLEAPTGDTAPAAYKPYLMLVGDKTLPTLPAALAAAGRRVEKVRVYTTRASASLAADIAAATSDSTCTSASGSAAASASTSTRAPQTPGLPKFAVLFSPSSAGYVLPLLADKYRVRADTGRGAAADADADGKRAQGANGGGGKRAAGALPDLGLVAIGDTTAAFLREHGWACDAVARTPDARGVLEAVCRADGRGVPPEHENGTGAKE